MESDSTNYCPTYSEDESIDQYIKEKRREEELEARQSDREREAAFADYYEEHKDERDSIFNYPGLKIIHFTPKRIKFSFQPSKVRRMISDRIVFYVSLRYRWRSWILRRDSIPSNYKLRVYRLFYTDGTFRFKEDADIVIGIAEIYKILLEWAKEEYKFRMGRYRRFQKGEDFYLYSDDEELFLSDSEREELHRKREIIWERMLPPTKEAMRTLRQRRPLRNTAGL